MLITLETVFLGILFSVALYTDIKWKKIPNILTLPVALTGILYNGYSMGITAGVLFALKGFAAGIFLLIIPFYLGGTGGGDVKLLGAAGSWLGAIAVINLFFYAAIAGAIIALFIMIRKRGFYFWNLLNDILLSIISDKKTIQKSKEHGMLYSIPLAIGFILYLLRGPLIK